MNDLTEAARTLAAAKAALDDLKREAAEERGTRPAAEPDHDDEDIPGGPRRCATCRHAKGFHDGTGRCGRSHDVKTRRVRTVFDVTCTERHIHEERCYKESTESYEEAEAVPCECRYYDGRTDEERRAALQREAEACQTCGHGPSFHPLPAAARCRCQHFTGGANLNANPFECGCGHTSSEHKDERGACEFVDRRARRGRCRKELSPPQIGGHPAPGVFVCFECRGYVARSEVDAIKSDYERRAFLGSL